MSKFLRFKDLRDRGIVSNRVTLSRWIKGQGFPRGILLGPNSRAYAEDQVEEWLETRAAEPEAPDVLAS